MSAPTPATPAPMRVIGLMSGTSADGIDAVLLRVDPARPEAPRHPVARVEASTGVPWSGALRRRIHDAAAGDVRTEELARLRVELAEGFAVAVLALLEGAKVTPDQVAVLCCHGQTVWHTPPWEDRRGATLQIVDPATLAALTGIPVVHDLRSADMAAGGHGAPLVAWADGIFFSHPERARAVLNIGGMANVTLLPPSGGGGEPLAFDIGPGNALIDLAVEWATDGREQMDRDGERAARGVVDTGLLQELLAHPFFEKIPPRSTGREEFGPTMIARLAESRGLIRGASERKWEIVIATLTTFTARSISRAFDRHLVPHGVDEVIVAGGGIHNPVLMAALQTALEPFPVQRAAEVSGGVAPDAREAAAFALLGWAFLTGVTGNVPASTGAEGPRILGSWTPAPGRPHPVFPLPELP